MRVLSLKWGAGGFLRGCAFFFRVLRVLKLLDRRRRDFSGKGDLESLGDRPRDPLFQDPFGHTFFRELRDQLMEGILDIPSDEAFEDALLKFALPSAGQLAPHPSADDDAGQGPAVAHPGGRALYR